MSRRDPIPALKQQLGAEARAAAHRLERRRCRVLIGTDRPRISELRRGKLDRSSLETLIRYLGRLQHRVDISVTREPITRAGIGRTSPPK